MKFEKKTFTNAVRLDGHVFVDCTFAGCDMIYRGGKVTMTRSKFNDAHWVMEGPAGRTLELLASFSQTETGCAVVSRLLTAAAGKPGKLQ